MQQFHNFEESVLSKVGDVTPVQLEVIENYFRAGKSVKDTVKAVKKAA